MPGNSEHNHKKIAETILVCLRQLSGGRGQPDAARIVVLGTLDETAERILGSELNTVNARIRCVRAFGSEEEIGLWQSRFGASLPEVQPLCFRLEEDLILQGMRLGECDLLTVVDIDRLFESRAVILTNLKRLLKKNALILLEARIDSTGDWKQALAQAGFDGVIARSERSIDKPFEAFDLLIARSDGQVQVRTPTDREPTRARDRIAERGMGRRRDSDGLNGAEVVQPRAEASTLAGPALNRETVRESIVDLLEQILARENASRISGEQPQ